IERIVEESFYGQQDLRLPEVEEALRKTYETVGRPEEVEAFVRSSLHRFGGVLEPLPDGTFLVVLPDARLTHLDPEGKGLRVTFDPNLALEDPGLQVLDLAHPLVRRLIELVKDEAAGRERGRFSSRAVQGANEVTAVHHVLTRYVTASAPPVVLEELLALAVPVFRDGASAQDALVLLRSPAAPLAHSREEIEEAGREALAHPSLELVVGEAVERRRRELEQRQRAIAAAGGEWTAGVDVLEVASTDRLSLTIVFPGHGR
ncbi:MAG: hypothetical protein ACRD3V_04240, partial [Vicinamibacteria bacterium]